MNKDAFLGYQVFYKSKTFCFIKKSNFSCSCYFSLWHIALFANAYFNLALVQAINNELAAAVSTLTAYQSMVPEEEGRKADELLRNLMKSVAAAKGSQMRR